MLYVFSCPRNFLFYWYLLLKNRCLEFQGSKYNKQKTSRYNHFVERPIFHFMTFFYCILLQNLAFYLQVLENWLFFDQKSRDMASLKRHFFMIFSTNIADTLSEDVKWMPNKIPKVSRRCLPSFNVRNVRQKRALYPPHPTPVWLNSENWVGK